MITNPAGAGLHRRGLHRHPARPGLVVSTPNGLTDVHRRGPNRHRRLEHGEPGGAPWRQRQLHLSVNVTGTPGVKTNSVTGQSDQRGTGNTATASVTVVAPPTLIKAFGAAVHPLRGLEHGADLHRRRTRTPRSPCPASASPTPCPPAGGGHAQRADRTCGGGTITATAGASSSA